jgi:hypothetical protein
MNLAFCKVTYAKMAIARRGCAEGMNRISHPNPLNEPQAHQYPGYLVRLLDGLALETHTAWLA